MLLSSWGWGGVCLVAEWLDQACCALCGRVHGVRRSGLCLYQQPLPSKPSESEGWREERKEGSRRIGSAEGSGKSRATAGLPAKITVHREYKAL